MSILKLVESINGDEYHKAKFTWAHQLWARQGQFVKFLSHSVRSKLLMPIHQAADWYSWRGLLKRVHCSSWLSYISYKYGAHLPCSWFLHYYKIFLQHAFYKWMILCLPTLQYIYLWWSYCDKIWCFTMCVVININNTIYYISNFTWSAQHCGDLWSVSKACVVLCDTNISCQTLAHLSVDCQALPNITPTCDYYVLWYCECLSRSV